MQRYFYPKRFGDRHLFSLLTVVPVSMRSLRTSSTREAFDLTGNPLYNPSWGYQDGKVRSGRIRREAVPLAAAAYRVRLTDATSLAATFTAETGIRRYSSLDGTTLRARCRTTTAGCPATRRTP